MLPVPTMQVVRPHKDVLLTFVVDVTALYTKLIILLSQETIKGSQWIYHF